MMSRFALLDERLQDGAGRLLLRVPVVSAVGKHDGPGDAAPRMLCRCGTVCGVLRLLARSSDGIDFLRMRHHGRVAGDAEAARVRHLDGHVLFACRISGKAGTISRRTRHAQLDTFLEV